MRLWSLHPRILDRAALVACWREALLAQKVLLGQTKGYTYHPQLDRFRRHSDPVGAIGTFLSGICDEADARGYHFNRSKIVRTTPTAIPVTQGQLDFEMEHLRTKVTRRAPDQLWRLDATPVQAHPMFTVIDGGVADWERT